MWRCFVITWFSYSRLDFMPFSQSPPAFQPCGSRILRAQTALGGFGLLKRPICNSFLRMARRSKSDTGECQVAAQTLPIEMLPYRTSVHTMPLFVHVKRSG